MNECKTTILLKQETRSILSKIGRKDQTYDDVIVELIESKNKLDLLESNGVPNSRNHSYS
jgi:hypothetical protein